MPKEPSRDGAERPPAFGNFDEVVRTGPVVGFCQFLICGMQSYVAARHDIGPKHRHQQVNIRRPGADAFEFDEFGFDLVIGQGMNGIEIDVLLDDRFGQMACVGSFLRAKTDSFEIGITDS